MKVSWCLSLFVFIFISSAHAEDGHHHDHSKKLKKIIIHANDEYFDSHRHDTTEKVEVLSKDRIDKSQAQSLNEAVDKMPGVDSQDYCVNCGAKRISINGLRGDHTSVLVDGIPLYSAVTSVYGFDAIPMQSVEEIEVKRGTGSALLNPEAIGGSINIITLMPKESGVLGSVSLGTYQTRSAQILQNIVKDGYKLSYGAEFQRQNAWDVDNNGLAESPWKSRYSLFVKQTINLNSHWQWAQRVSFAEMEIVGGNTGHQRINSPSPVQASDFDFVDGDVRKPYIGAASQITEYIQVQRSEATSKLIGILDSENSLEWSLGYAQYNQDSYYMHGFDYLTEDKTFYTDVKWRHQLSENQGLLVGSSFRSEALRSESQIMYTPNGIPRDNFDFKAYSIFLQHEWFLPFDIEMSSALRAERLDNRWLELGDLDRTVISPRWLLKWSPTEHLSQQLAYGYGYRMPLTSIESAHGAYDGFVVGITELEKSQSVVYSISYNTPEFYVTPSVHYTHLKNMSYPLEPLVAHSGPLRFVNDSEDYDIFVYDLLTGFKPTPDWLIEAGYEVFRYPDGYKAKIPTAAIEERVNLRAEYETQKFTWIVSGSWVGSRDISKYYQYEDHYNVSDGLLGVSDPKWSRAPSYWQWDASFIRKYKKSQITFGVQNLFNYTQTKAGDSPAMWHEHDGHTHFDNRHVWGPNRGREFFVKWSFDL